MELDLAYAKTVAGPVLLALLWLAEGAVPFYEQFRGRPRDRLRHDGRNLAFGLFNAALLALLFAGLIAAVAAWADRAGFGLLRLVSWPAWAETLLAFLLIDLWMYLWHRANHAVPFLWRFHRLHHSDPDMDVTTGVRFHAGEVVLSALARLAVVPILGVSLWQVAFYEVVFLPVVLFHHSNVSLPRWLDYGLMALIVTPAMHRVHHSRWLPETNSNYGSVLPWWDWILRSFRVHDDCRAIRLGLDEFDSPKWQGIFGMLRTPLAPTPRAARKRGLSRGEEASEEAGKAESTPSVGR